MSGMLSKSGPVAPAAALLAGRANAALLGGAMGTYRLLFFNDGNLCGRFDFQADDDHQAAETAEILFNACSDRALSWGIFNGTIFVSSGPVKIRARLQASDLAEHRKEIIIQCEETILNSKWSVGSSKRLLADLDKLKASSGRARPVDKISGRSSDGASARSAPCG